MRHGYLQEYNKILNIFINNKIYQGNFAGQSSQGWSALIQTINSHQ